MNRHWLRCSVSLAFASVLLGQDVRSWRQANERSILDEFLAMLALPNVASDRANIRRNADLLVMSLQKRGATARLLEVDGAPPSVLGDLKTPGATRTVVFYAHYDGQPVDPKDWQTDPFRPVIRDGSREVALSGAINPEWRIYARSASDDKAPIQAMFSALDALAATGRKPAVNLKFFFEGEEEAGSPNLRRLLEAHRSSLGGDVWLICDGPVHQSRRAQVYFGVRGVVGFDLTLFGATRELHSGHYGNWAPNPAMMLAQLLAAMKDQDGRVLIPGWYEGLAPLSESERNAIAAAPDNDADLRRELGLGWTEGGGKSLMELIHLPSLNIRGINSAGTGELSRNVVPSRATASLDVRLVKGFDHERPVELLKRFIESKGYFIVDREPDAATRAQHKRIAMLRVSHGYNAARTSLDLPVSKWVLRAVESVRGDAVRMPTLGGSVPLVIFEEVLRTPFVGVPIVNHDNNQHSANENVRIQNLWDGIEVFAALMTSTW